MIPILFDKTETNFTSNGIGRLSDAISCTVEEEGNGKYVSELTYPVTGEHYAEIEVQSIIYCATSQRTSPQPFRVEKITKPINGKVKIYANHLSYDLSKNVCMPFTVAAGPSACATAIAALKTNAVEDCPFDFWTDVNTVSGYKQTAPASIKSRLGGVEGSILDQFGGQYEWDHYHVKLHRQRGRINTGIILKYGKNITDLTQEENIANTVTGVVPFWSDLDGETLVTLPEKAVYSQHAASYPFKLTEPLDLSANWDEAPSVASLRLAAEAYIAKSDLGVPKVSIDVSFIPLWDTEEFASVAPLEEVGMYDEVTVEFEKLGVQATAKVVRTVYDCLKERYREITIGSIRSTLAQTLNDKNKDTIQTISDMGQRAAVSSEDLVNKATAWLRNGEGYIMARTDQDGNWKELFAMDTADPTEAVDVIRINKNGIGGSTHGIDGPFNVAMLIDGTIVASLIATGILQDRNGNFVLNLDTGTLSIGGNASMNGQTLSAMQTTISLTAEGLSSEVTNRQNADSGLSSRITQNAESISSEVTNRTNADSALSSRITQNAESISMKVSKGDVSSQISVESGQITLTGGRLVITTGKFQLTAGGIMTCKGANIEGELYTGDIDGNNYLNYYGVKIHAHSANGESWINFNNSVGSQYRVIELKGGGVSFSVGKIYVADEGSYSVATGQTATINYKNHSGGNCTLEFKKGILVNFY